jgi:hypothetical protein
MKIKRFEEFEETNEGLRSSISIISILIGLGLGNPDTILANQEKIENSINTKEEQTLHLIDSLNDDDIFNKMMPIDLFKNEIEKYNYNNYKIDLKLEEVIKIMQQPSFPIKIDLFFVNIGKQVPITTFEYQHSDKITFMLTKNEIWDKNMLGFRINF